MWKLGDLRSLSRIDELVERLFLLRRALEKQEYVIDREICGDRAAIIDGVLRFRARVARQRYIRARVDLLGYPRLRIGSRFALCGSGPRVRSQRECC